MCNAIERGVRCDECVNESLYTLRGRMALHITSGLSDDSAFGFQAYRRPGFNCVVKQLRFWLFKVDCEFKDCDLRVLRIGHTCVIYTLRSNNCEL